MSTAGSIHGLIQLKARLLSIGLISISEHTIEMARVQNRKLARLITELNLYTLPWLFLRLNDRIRVRMIACPAGKSELELRLSESDINLYEIVDDRQDIIAQIMLEESIYHCPEQMFFLYYNACVNDCKYCPCPIGDPNQRDSIERMIETGRSVNRTNLRGIGITSAVPSHLTVEELDDEIAQAVRALRKEWGDEIPIGVSSCPCSRRSIERLKEAGASEIRINLETFDQDLHKVICPRKPLDLILRSLKDAVDVFGHNKVSSNIVVGLGETDTDIERGIETLCKMGVVPTLYPFDPIPRRIEQLQKLTGGRACRPSAQRLLSLAGLHKELIERYGLNPAQLKTMCPSCAASHLMPGIDF